MHNEESSLFIVHFAFCILLGDVRNVLDEILTAIHG